MIEWLPAKHVPINVPMRVPKYVSMRLPMRGPKSWCSGTGNFGFILLFACDIGLPLEIPLGFQFSIFYIIYKMF